MLPQLFPPRSRLVARWFPVGALCDRGLRTLPCLYACSVKEIQAEPAESHQVQAGPFKLRQYKCCCSKGVLAYFTSRVQAVQLKGPCRGLCQGLLVNAGSLDKLLSSLPPTSYPYAKAGGPTAAPLRSLPVEEDRRAHGKASTRKGGLQRAWFNAVFWRQGYVELNPCRRSQDHHRRPMPRPADLATLTYTSAIRAAVTSSRGEPLCSPELLFVHSKPELLNASGTSRSRLCTLPVCLHCCWPTFGYGYYYY